MPIRSDVSARLSSSKQGSVQIGWTVAGGLLAIGAALLLFALNRGKSPSNPEKQVEQIPLSLQQDLERLKLDLKTAQHAVSLKQTEADAKRSEKSQLSARLDAREAEVRKLEAANAEKKDSARAEAEQTRVQTNQEIGQANKAFADKALAVRRQEDLEKILQIVRNCTVTVATKDNIVATAFFYSTPNAVLVVVPSGLAARNENILAKMIVLNNNRQTTVLVEGTLWRSDEVSGLSFYTVAAGLEVNCFASRDIGDATLGDKVYTVSTQVIGGGLFEHNVQDGNVSNLAREVENRKYLQLALPANPGAVGAPVISANGTLVGVLMGQLPGMEKTSIALPATELKAAIERIQRGAAGVTAGSGATSGPPQVVVVPNLPATPPPTPQMPGQPGQPNNDDVRVAGAAFKVPYDAAKTIDFAARDLATPCFFPGLDDTLVVWDEKQAKLAAYKPGESKPLWNYAAGKDILKVVPSIDRESVLLIQGINSPDLILELKNGTVRARLSAKVDQNVQAYAAFRDCFAFRGAGDMTTFARPNGMKFGCGEIALALVGRQGDTIYLASKYSVGTIPSVSEYARAMAGYDGLSSPRPPLQASAFLQAMRKATIQINLTPSIPWTLWGQVCLIPQTNRIIAGWNIFEISATGSKQLGAFTHQPHSGAQTVWFKAFAKVSSTKPIEKINTLSVSPDGAYAISETHLYDVATMQVKAELPFPCAACGFLSKGRTVWLYDFVNEKIAFMTIDEIINTKR